MERLYIIVNDNEVISAKKDKKELLLLIDKMINLAQRNIPMRVLRASKITDKPEKNRLTFADSEHVIINRTNENYTLSNIRDYLVANNYPTKRGGSWTITTVRRIQARLTKKKQ
jgi:hypothetical protein